MYGFKEDETMKRKTVSLMLVVSMMAATAAGCGSSESNDTASTTGTAD